MPEVRVLKALAGASCALLLGLVLSSCSHQDSSSSAPTTSPPAPTVPFVIRVTSVKKPLPRATRARVRTKVGSVVDGWWRSAYLTVGGGDRFPGFTPGAAKLAKRDADLLSNAGMAGRITAVTATRRQMDLDVLAAKGVARGVTARLHLTYTTTGQRDQGCFVGGTVSLIPVHGSWRIFGYDVTHTCHPRKAGS